MSTMNSIRDTFFEECEDLLADLADGLSKMQAGTADPETVNAVFRAVHSVKGGAGAFQLTELVGFSHQFETVLDELRSERLKLTPELMFTLLRSADHLSVLIEAARDGNEVDASVTENSVAALKVWLGGSKQAAAPAAGEPEAAFSFAPVTLDFGAFDAEPSAVAADDSAQYTIHFAPNATLFANGHEPAFLFNDLSQLGSVTAKIDLTDLPEWEQFDTTMPFMAWQIELVTTVPMDKIKSVFEFVEGLCKLEITQAEAAAPAPAPIATAAPVTAEPVAAAPITPEPEVAKPVAAPPPAAAPESAAPAAPVAPPAAKAAVAAPTASEQHGPKPTLRVELDRVDRLINAVGELIINQAMISQRVDELPVTTDTEVVTYVEDYRLLARDIQEAVMAIRAQPVKPLFQRMSRIVREAADATGKTAQLLAFGEEIEVDKTVIERLADPLTHMIRNAVDHGLESPEERKKVGKDACGTIRLSAAHRSGRVIISIKDDGAGLNRPKILKIAKDKGLIPQDADLADSDIDGLLFLPGFSTAQKVSNLSGRGVGLDVVRTAVMALGGRVAITSVPGQGTEFTISLPLTLAVMDGMVVSVSGQTMIAPISSIVETIRPAANEVHNVGPTSKFLSIRGAFIPIVDVAASLGIEQSTISTEPPLLLLVENENQSQCALIVDEVHDQRQVVIKGLEHNYRSVSGVSAATVLGNGQIALILDLDAIAFQRSTAEINAETALHAKGA
jgi:two-component system, chemotaxis family, sensor kinase CheA